MKKSDIDSVIRILRKEVKKYPQPVISAIGLRENAFKVLISCILSLRTKDDVTAPASYRLFDVAGTPEKLSKLSISKIEKLIYPVGFYKRKTIQIKEISKRLVDEYNSKVPDTISELMTFKGVGRKTANLVVAVGHHKPAMCVDVHVHRISNRLGYVKTKTNDETEFELRRILPLKYWETYNEYLVTFGQNICKPVSPFCSRCVLYDYCGRVGVLTSR